MARVFLALAAGAAIGLWCEGAQAESGRFAGTLACKLDSQHVLPARHYRFGVGQLVCEWSKPLELLGDKAKDTSATDVFQVSGDRTDFRGVFAITMASGAQASLLYQGTRTDPDGKPPTISGTLTLTDGTDRLKGISGRGTLSCSVRGDVYTCDIEGSYEQPGH